jgi:hypothetical protein
MAFKVQDRVKAKRNIESRRCGLLVYKGQLGTVRSVRCCHAYEVSWDGGSLVPVRINEIKAA